MLQGTDMPFDLEDEEQKRFFREAVKSGIDSWLNARFQMVGKWTVRGLFAAAFAAFAHWLISNGWPK